MKTRILFVTGIAILLIGYNFISPHYTDKQMNKHLLDNQSDFNKLVQMFEEDKQISSVINLNSDSKVFPVDIYSNSSLNNEKLLSKTQNEDYLRLLKKLNIKRISRNNVDLIKMY